MKKPTTVKELIDHAVELGACDGPGSGPVYLAKLGHNDVVRAGVECYHQDLLIWYLGRVDPSSISAFAHRCAMRSRSGYTASHAEASKCAVNAASAAEYAAAAAASARYTDVTELAKQLEDLHAMWRAWFADGA